MRSAIRGPRRERDARRARDGEERILALYDDALNLAQGDAAVVALSEAHRGELAKAIDRMRALEIVVG